MIISPQNTIQRIHIHSVSGSITVWLTYFNFLDLAALLMLNDQQIYLFGGIQTSETGGRPSE